MLNKKGFSLVELMVVVIIIAVLSVIAVPQYTTAMEKSRTAEAIVNLKAMGDALNRYYAIHDSYPPGANIADMLGRLDTSFDVPKYYSARMIRSGSGNSLYIYYDRTTNPRFMSGNTKDTTISTRDNFSTLNLILVNGEHRSLLCEGKICRKVYNCQTESAAGCTVL
ncbi:prepilin-type N-terminal cleavage/methylation domain-containing protein [Elusimicrobium posterum]|uniref:type IV pilin protein n=1 Tax=Elusimicrobium posterum TaxID=3116653 RepID=UPI003C70CA66